jgi:hypothetical protein
MVLVFSFVGISNAGMTNWTDTTIDEIAIDNTSGGSQLPIFRRTINGVNYWIAPTATNADRVLSVALTALSMGKNVNIQWTDNSPIPAGCNGTLVWISIVP